jgi:hypothetical protein
MKRGPEIRSMRIDDLRGVFLLGREFLPPHGHTGATGWKEQNIARVLARGLDVSFVAIYKKKIIGFLIGLPEDAGTDAGAVTIQWLCAPGADVRADLLHVFRQSVSETKYAGIRAEIPASNPELYEFFRKFDFTESEHLLIMENFPPKKNR